MSVSSEVEQRIAALREQIDRGNYEYYVLDNPTMTDAEWDAALRELRALEERPRATARLRMSRRESRAADKGVDLSILFLLGNAVPGGAHTRAGCVATSP